MEITCSKEWFQDNLRRIQGILMMNQRQFGELIGISRQLAGAWTRGTCEMPIYAFIAYKYVFERMDLDPLTEEFLQTIFDEDPRG